MHPGLLVGGSLRGVIAKNWREGSNFDPAREQIWRWRSSETADISAHQRVTRQAKILQIGRHHAQVIP